MAAFAIDLLGAFEERDAIFYESIRLAIDTFAEPSAAFVASNSENELVQSAQIEAMFALLLRFEDFIGMQRATACLSEQRTIVFAAFKAKEAILQRGFLRFGLLAEGFRSRVAPFSAR